MTLRQGGASRPGSFWRHLGLASLLSLVPVLLLLFGFEHEFDQEFTRLREEMARKVEVRFEGIRDPDFLCGAFRDFITAMILNPARSSRNPEEYLARSFKLLDSVYPGAFEAAIFDGRNQLIASLSGLPEHHELLREFGRDYAELQMTGRSAINEKLALYRRFLGVFFNSFDVPRRGVPWHWLVQYASLSRKRAYWTIPTGISGQPWIMVWVSFPKNHREFLFQLMVDQKYQVASLSDLINLDDPPEKWGARFGPAALFTPKAVALLGDQEGTAVFADGFVWIQFLVSPRKRLVMAVPDEATGKVESLRWKFLAAGGLLWGSLLLLPLAFRNWDPAALSLRTKLLALFVYTTGVPIGMLFLSAQGLFHERREIMERRIFQEQEKAMTEFERRYQDYLGWLEMRVLALKGPPLPVGSGAREKALQIMPRLIAGVKPQVCELFDESGKSIYHHSSEKGELFSRLLPFIGSQVGTGISRYNRTETSLQDSAKEQTFKASLESLGLEIEQMASNIGAVNNALVPLDLGGSKLVVLNLLVVDTNGKLRFMVVLAWTGIPNAYFEERLPGFQKKHAEIQLGVRLKTSELLFPATFPLAAEIVTMNGLVSRQGATVHLKVPRSGKTWLFSGLRSKEFETLFYACSTDDRVRDEIRKTALRLTLIGVFLMNLGIGIGWMISRSFLHPIGLLSEGVAAMKSRDFSARVPVTSADEFGRLGEAFNRMLEGMADLEVARIVQDTFFPQESLAASGWEVFGSSVSASRVGGDYFDYFPLGDGRWLILIGDVSGHGVSASLVVAMAKALAFHPANPTRPSQILEILSQTLQQTLQRKRLMSCFLATFDPRHETLLASNAGHNFPFLLKGGRAEEVAIVNAMLGARARKPYEDHPIACSGMDALVLYTDGIIEALDTQGSQIGYGRFQAALPGLVRPGARETETAIRAWFATLARPGPLADDISLVVLQKNGGHTTGKN